MTNLYRYAILYFLLFSILLTLSGIMIFEHKIGFSVENILTYYLGDVEKFINAKSYSGVLKTVLPHILAFGLFNMVLLHFLIFTKYKDTKSVKILIYLLYTSAFFEVFSPFVILLGLELFSYIKLLSFAVFQLTTLYVVWLLFRSAIKG